MLHRVSQYIQNCFRPKVRAEIVTVTPEKILDGKVALITGGTSGIGKAIAIEFAKAGALVFITGRNIKKINSVVNEIAIWGDIRGLEMDNMNPSSFTEKISEIESSLPSGKKTIDILVNNAGLVGGDIRSTNENQFDTIISTNLKSVFFLSKIVADNMIRNGIKGNILNIASSSSLRPAISAYTLSKWGIRGLTLGMAKMFIPHGITVNGLAPGPTATPMVGRNDYDDIGLSSIPLGRFLLPEEISQLALFLCGPQGKGIIGDIIYMTGGAGVIDYNDLNYNYNPIV